MHRRLCFGSASTRPAALVWVGLAAAIAHGAEDSRADAPPIRDFARPTDAELATFLTPEPRKSPAEALATFEIAPGFHVELMAAEPMVYDPVAAAFDEDGNLYVAEMRDYPYPGLKQSNHTPRFPGDQFREDEYTPPRTGRHAPTKPGDKPLGAVRLLRDTDGDGKFDRVTVFADGLLWACGIVPWKGGVFVTAPPDIWYLKDTDGDGVADVREKIFTGFGTRNQQAMLNNIQFGLDHRIYGSTAGNGGDVRPANEPAAIPVSLAGYDFRFAPGSSRLERVTGTRQFGLAFDDFGNRFLCTQNAPCFHVVLPLQYLERNPYFTPHQTIANTSAVPTPLHRISPVEKWRFLQSGRAAALSEVSVQNVAGISHHVVDAAAGITIYRGGAYPDAYYGNVFVGDSVSNLVHRRVLLAHGSTFKSERADVNTEFLRATDIWFRPVNFVNAPDGTLWVLDMSREYSESINIPPDIERHLDLTTRDQGRIYRIAPDGFRSPAPPRLSRASTAQLVAALESPHGWWRDTAHRLLFERQDKSAAPALEAIALRGDFAAARVAALWSLEGMDALTDATLAAVLSGAPAGVLENAIRLAEPRLERSSDLRARVSRLAGDSSPRVRLQVAFAVGECHAWNQAELLTRLTLENLEDPWIQSAILSSAFDCAGALFETLARQPAEFFGRAGAVDFGRQLATMIGAQNRSADVGQAVARLADVKSLAAALPLACALSDGLKRASSSLAAADLLGQVRGLLRGAPQLALDVRESVAVRRAAVEALSLLPYAEAAPALRSLMDSRVKESLQLAAIAAFDQFHDSSVGDELVDGYRALGSTARARAIDAVLQRPERLAALWRALEAKAIQPGELSARQRDLLRKHREPGVRERALRLLGAPNPASREDVYRRLLPAVGLNGIAARGEATFEARCAVCHRFAGRGHEFGPDLTAVRSGGKEKILASIVDPNREVLPQYFSVAIETRDGESIGGLLRNETATTVTLGQPGGVERTVPRADIATMKTSERSFMPEGLEAGLGAEDIADLLAFLVAPPP